jgi:transcriptional regulator with XRE-family HTH domain
VPWPSLDHCTPLGTLLVEWMWAQRPPTPVALLASRVGVDRSTLFSWLTTDRQPQPLQLLLLAQVTSLPLTTLTSAADVLIERVMRQRDVLWDYVEWEMGGVGSTSDGGDEVLLEQVRQARASARRAVARTNDAEADHVETNDGGKD